MSGNFGPKLSGSVWSNRKSFKKTGPPFEVDHFSQSDQLEFWLNGSHPQCSAIYHGSSYSLTRIAVNQGQSVNRASNNLTLIITFLVLIVLCSHQRGFGPTILDFIFNFNILFNVTLIEHFTSLTSQVLPCLTLVEVEAKLFSRILPKVLLKIFNGENLLFLPLSLHMVGCFLRYK